MPEAQGGWNRFRHNRNGGAIGRSQIKINSSGKEKATISTDTAPMQVAQEADAS
jgi:hypothetical protein